MSNRRKHRPKISELKTPETSAQCWLCGMGLGSESSNIQYSGLCMSCYMDCQDDDILLAVFEGVAV